MIGDFILFRRRHSLLYASNDKDWKPRGAYNQSYFFQKVSIYLGGIKVIPEKDETEPIQE